ncbi:MAG: hypothetical protein IPH27_06300 [Actinomycetales bacterium]|nr:hypothetical protein [Candidatus Phosphoribacter baldrii]
MFIFVAGAASERWGIVSFTVYSAGLVWLMTTYRNLTGMWANGWNASGRRPWALALFVLLLPR